MRERERKMATERIMALDDVFARVMSSGGG